MIYRICKPQWVVEHYCMCPAEISAKTRRNNEASARGRLVMVKLRESKWAGGSLEELHIAPEGAEESWTRTKPKWWPKNGDT